MYVHDFATLAARAEAGSDVEAAVLKRGSETRSHAALMDARKEPGHLEAVAERLRREAFLMRVAELLNSDAPDKPAALGSARRWPVSA